MGKQNVWNMPRPPMRRQKITVTDAKNQPGKEFDFYFVGGAHLRAHQAQDVQEQLCQKYIGRLAAGGIRVADENTMTFPAVGDPPEPVEVSESLFELVAQMFVMQDEQQPPENLYSPEEIVAFAASAPGAWTMLLGKSAKFNNPPGDGEDKKKPEPTETQ